MAKNPPAGNGHRARPARDGWIKRDTGGQKNPGRAILFPTEPSTIGHKKIDRAVERVISKKK